MSHTMVAIILVSTSFDFRFFSTSALTCLTQASRRRAFSNFSRSDSVLNVLEASKNTYLKPPLMFSRHSASHVTSLRSTTSPHEWPLGGLGGGWSALWFMVICSGMMRVLTRPALGCAPRPKNKPGGSTVTFPAFCSKPSTKHNLYSLSMALRSANSALRMDGAMLFLRSASAFLSDIQ